MPPTGSHVVWTWIDEDKNPKYVGWGKYETTHPAKTLWAKRKSMRSRLNDWLLTLDREPERSDHISQVMMTQTEASAIAAELRRQYRGQLLDSRTLESRRGGGLGRGVLGPDLKLYESVREAAADIDVNASTITRWCQAVDSGWDYIQA